MDHFNYSRGGTIVGIFLGSLAVGIGTIGEVTTLGISSLIITAGIYDITVCSKDLVDNCDDPWIY